ncbi:hypothetical protein PInf_005083 [Phytophthora infestans]|nr:hypothetical protein PInf_005083 [Phytophthora infestans]
MDIMMRLKGAGFSAIANAFREREKRLGGGLPLPDFVEIVLPGLPRVKTAEEKTATVSALVDLFEDIDINGDGVMEFDEFTSFCVDAAQRMLRFCESSALLLGSGNDFIVNIWKVVDAETKFLWRRLSVHADLVMDALEIPVHDLLVTCDLRHTIQLWDITDGRNRGALMAHGRGVRQLCYSEHHDLLLSAGFEFEALAWDLGSRQVALKLSGHRAPLVGVQLALFQTERAITADSDGVFKVWDITRGHASSTNASISQAVQLESIDLG